MSGIFSALRRSLFAVLLTFCFLFAGGEGAWAIQWYSSNTSSQAISPLSATLAKRAAWALSIELVGSQPPKGASAALSAALTDGATLEKQQLWKEGTLYSLRWAVYAESGHLVFSELHQEGHGSSQRYAEDGRLLEESLEAYQDKRVVIRYRYGSAALLSSLCSELVEGPEGPSEVPLWEDSYFYTRSGSLRLVKRTVKGGEAPLQIFRLHRSQGIPLRLETWSKGSLAISSSFDGEGREKERTFFSEDGTMVKSVERYTYTDSEPGSIRTRLEETGLAVVVERETDGKGHVVRECRLDAEGKVLSEAHNEWTAGNLQAVTIVTSEGTARLEYEYDAKGTITVERNYFNGELERTLTRNGSLETEELFLHGSLILRALYDGGKKQSEERFPLSRKASYEK